MGASSSSSSSSSLNRLSSEVKENVFLGETIMRPFNREIIAHYMDEYEFVPFTVKRQATNQSGPHSGTRMHTLLICTTFKHDDGRSIVGIAGYIGSANNYYVIITDGDNKYLPVKFSDTSENIKEFKRSRCAATDELNQYNAAQIAFYSYRSE